MVVDPIAGIEGSTLVRAVVSSCSKLAVRLWIQLAPQSGPDARRCAREARQSRLFDAAGLQPEQAMARSDGLQQGRRGPMFRSAIVPTGTGNILAHETGIIANSSEKSPGCLSRGRIVPIQGGSSPAVNPCLPMASAGLDGRVTAGCGSSHAAPVRW